MLPAGPGAYEPPPDVAFTRMADDPLATPGTRPAGACESVRARLSPRADGPPGTLADLTRPTLHHLFESCARVRFSQLGLEPPELQGHILSGKGALIARTDFCWRRHHTVAEADGMLKYGEQDDLNRQFARDRLLREAGWEVVHFTWKELFSDAGRIVTQIRAAFGRAAGLRG